MTEDSFTHKISVLQIKDESEGDVVITLMLNSVDSRGPL